MSQLKNSTTQPGAAPSISEKHGIDALGKDDLEVYSVGTSTGGAAEIQMAKVKSRHIVATTIDQRGLKFAKECVAQKQLQSQIELKLEDAAEPLPYKDNHFDYIYARLILHYLPEDKLIGALSDLHRVLKPNGRIFIVVRSNKCAHATMDDSVFDPATKLTEYTETDPERDIIRIKRHFFSENDLKQYVDQAGFSTQYVTSLDEHLFKDFRRTFPDTHADNLVELLAAKTKT